MFRFPGLDKLRDALKRAWGPTEVVTQETSAAVDAVLKDPNIIENPTLADFERLEIGDTLISINPGTQRLIVAIDKAKKQLTCRVTRDTSTQSLPLIPFYRSKSDKMYMSKSELMELGPDTLVYTMEGNEFVPTIIHSITPGRLPTDRLTGKYSFDGVCKYEGKESIIKVTKKIRKKKQES